MAAEPRSHFSHPAACDAGPSHGPPRDPIDRTDLTWLKYGTFREPLVWNLLPHEVSLAAWLVGVAPSLRVTEHRSGETVVDRLVADLDFGADGPRGTITIDRLHGEKLKSAVVRTRSGDELRWQKLSRACREHYERTHSGAQTVARYERLFEGLGA